MALREEVLQACFTRNDSGKPLAAGQPANNKLELENIESLSELRAVVVRKIGELVMPYDPEFVIGVPYGAIWIADAIAKEYGIEYAPRLKARGTASGKQMQYDNEFVDGEVIVRNLSRGVLVEDVFNHFTNTRRALAVPGLSEKIVGIVGIWDRGVSHENRETPTQPYQALVTEHIDEMLAETSELWRFAAEASAF
ncbi:MAG: hypothetical protein WA843_03595 [Candidatus Saccharimonadales bacterium]